MTGTNTYFNHLTCFLFTVFLFFSANAQKTENEQIVALSKYINFQTLALNEPDGGNYFADLALKKNMDVTFFTRNDSTINFTASIYPLKSDKPNIVFLNHIDVVSPGDSSDWHFAPFCGKIENNIIHGRGAIDNKGMAIAQLYAIEKFRDEFKGQELPFNVTLLSVSDEENGGMRGARQICEFYLNEINPVLVLGEGGSGIKGIIRSAPEIPVFGTSTVEKSKMILELELNLTSSGHGSVPPEEYAGKTMITALSRLLNDKPRIILSRTSINALKTLGYEEKGMRGFVQRHFTSIAFYPFVKRQIKKDPMVSSFFTNTIALTNLSTLKTDANQISNKITATLDCRLLPASKPDVFIRSVKRKLRDKRITVNVVQKEIAGFQTTEPQYFEALTKAIKQEYPGSVNVEIIFPATSDNYLFRRKGIPVFGIFPAVFTEDELKCIHGPDERIRTESLESAINIYYNFLRNLTLMDWSQVKK
jgi:carboxypeptidase PM20D1